MARRLGRRPMRRIPGILAALAALAATSAWADPLRSPACVAALAALTLAEDAVSARPSSPPGGTPKPPAPASLHTARRAAAEACLGGAEDMPLPAPRLRAPRAVDQPALPAPQPALEQPPARTAAPAPRQAPHMITVCDAHGCWTNEGLRLQRQGTLLQGPRGPCLQIGAVLNCP